MNNEKKKHCIIIVIIYMQKSFYVFMLRVVVSLFINNTNLISKYRSWTFCNIPRLLDKNLHRDIKKNV